MNGLGQDFEFVALGTGTFQQVGGSGLAGEEQDLATGQELRMLMAASMPFISGMMTSLMTRSGFTLRARSTAAVPVYTAEASKPCWFRMIARVSAMTRSSSTTSTLGLPFLTVIRAAASSGMHSVGLTDRPASLCRTRELPKRKRRIITTGTAIRSPTVVPSCVCGRISKSPAIQILVAARLRNLGCGGGLLQPE